MPLIRDEEFGKEINQVAHDTVTRGKGIIYMETLIVSVVLACTIYGLNALDASSAVMISVTVATASVCTVYILSLWFLALQGALAITVGTIEWIGRKRLGEYEKPS